MYNRLPVHIFASQEFPISTLHQGLQRWLAHWGMCTKKTMNILAFVRVDKFVNYFMPAMPSNQAPPSNQGVFFFIMSASNMIYESVCENVFLCI